MFKITVKLKNEERSAVFDKAVLLSEALEKLGVIQNKPCGGKGICKKCKVIVDSGEVLACSTYISEDTCVDYTADLKELKGLTDGYAAEYKKKPLVECGLGMAVDIGTTTVAGSIYSFPECEKIKESAVANTQAAHGADVISRIEFSNSGGLKTLQSMVMGQIEKLKDGAAIEKYVITGNTTMLHLLTGKDPHGIAVSPFTPETLFGVWDKNVFLPGCISAYIGADITCAILSSGIMNDKTSFLVDIGTNGEMVLWHNGKLLCCSAAAGPALEGGEISQGMLAVSGAINSVFIRNGQIGYTTVDDAEPVGICGTGIIDAVACMKKLGILDKSGFLEADHQIGSSGVYITQKDVRQVQLAKAAIRAGIDTLLHECGISCADIDRFCIAGGFGSFIRIETACEIGLIPRESADKAFILGNAALSGAEMILQSEDCLSSSLHIAEGAETVELSTNPYFTEKYIENMYL